MGLMRQERLDWVKDERVKKGIREGIINTKDLWKVVRHSNGPLLSLASHFSYRA